MISAEYQLDSVSEDEQLQMALQLSMNESNTSLGHSFSRGIVGQVDGTIDSDDELEKSPFVINSESDTDKDSANESNKNCSVKKQSYHELLGDHLQVGDEPPVKKRKTPDNSPLVKLDLDSISAKYSQAASGSDCKITDSFTQCKSVLEEEKDSHESKEQQSGEDIGENAPTVESGSDPDNIWASSPSGV